MKPGDRVTWTNRVYNPPGSPWSSPIEREGVFVRWESSEYGVGTVAVVLDNKGRETRTMFPQPARKR